VAAADGTADNLREAVERVVPYGVAPSAAAVGNHADGSGLSAAHDGWWDEPGTP
jgi:hypothetical protein